LSIRTVASANVVGKSLFHVAVELARLVPKIEIQDPGWTTATELKTGTIPFGAMKGGWGERIGVGRSGIAGMLTMYT